MAISIQNIRQNHVDFYECLLLDIRGFKKSKRQTGSQQFITHHWNINAKGKQFEQFSIVLNKAEQKLKQAKQRLDNVNADQERLNTEIEIWKELQISI